MCELGQFQTIVHGGEMKGNPEMGETAIQPVPAQTTDLSISECLHPVQRFRVK